MADENALGESDFAQWISPRDALVELDIQWSRDISRSTIVRHLMHGEMRAVCATAVLTRSGRQTRAARFLVPSDRWAYDRPSYHSHFWENGLFDFTMGYGQSATEVACFDVRFDPAVIRGLIQIPSIVADAAKPKLVLRNVGNVEEDDPPPSAGKLPPINVRDLERVVTLIVELWGTSLTETNAWSMAKACFPDHSVAKHRFLAQFRKIRPAKSRGKQAINH